MSKNRSLYSAATLRTLLHAFGMRAMPFFEFYDTLKQSSLGGEPPPDGFVDTFRDLSRLIVRTLNTEVSKAKLLEVTQQIRPLLHQLDLDQGSKHLYVRIAGLYASLIMDVAADQEVFLTTIPSGSVGWVMLRMMSDKEQKVERLRRSDPAHFDAIQQTRTLRKEIDRRVEQAVVDLGMTPSKKMVMGRPVITGIDPISQDELVFTDDGEYATIPEFITKRRQEAQARKETTRVFPNIEDLRKFGDEEIDALTVGDIEYVAMTDDKAKSHNLTRIYPTKRMIDGEVVVVSGRYKGFLIDDLVNRAGRMIEGVAYDMDPKSGLPVVMETKDPKSGLPVVRANREPYVTVGSKGDLYLRIPATKQYTAVRNAVAELSKIVPSLQYEAGSRKAVFTFTPAEFAAVREALGGVALSKSAAKALQEHFAGMAKHELALSASNLQHFDTDRIGGFKPGKRLFHKQKEAMAWLESNGHSGVMALDTGLGKCVTGDTRIWTNRGLVQIQELNPGLTDPDTDATLEDCFVRVNGEDLPVASFYYGGVKPTVKATLASGLVIEGSFVHPIAVRGPEGESWVTMPELKIGDAVCIDRTVQAFADEEPTLPIPRIENFHDSTLVYGVPDRMTPDLARLLGYMVGEAHTNSDHAITITQHITENPEPHKDIRDTLLSTIGWANDLRSTHTDTTIRVCGKYLRSYFEGIGLNQAVAAGKYVPPVIFQATKASVREFLRAIFEGEGSSNNGNVEMTSASERLIREIQQLLLGFGIMGRISPKHVKGYSHTYWRIQIMGGDARLFRDHIGFISSKKMDILVASLDKPHNTNLDVVPYSVPLVEALRTEISKVASGSKNGGGIVSRWGSSFISTMQHIRMGRRNPSYPFLHKMLAVAAEVGVTATKAYEDMQDFVARHLLYDPIVKLELSMNEVMDIAVADPRHCFIGNGVLNHNTSLAIATMQKMVRDGLLGDDQQFLYVCPPALRGNLPKEIEAFLEDPKTLRSRVRIMTYPEFTKATKADPDFATHYAAVMFDEAQALKNPTSGTSAAAMSLRHPKKILLTASPMEKSPMEVFSLVAISSNLNLNTREGRAQIKAFRKRFCEEVGGKIIGIKNDPVTARDFRIWVKQNLYFADKRDVEEIALPELHATSVAVTMHPEIEARYRQVSSGIANVIKGMVAKYRDRSISATDPAIESARIKLAKQFRALFNLINFPESIVPGASNPKVEQVVSILDERVGSGRRTLVFTDSPDLAKNTAKSLSERFPVHFHAECAADSIRIWRTGTVVKTYPAQEYTEGDRTWPKTEWKGYVLDRVISPRPDIMSCVLTSTYSTGQNLQSFDTVVHLDRDAWNNETMKQRTARAWRTGQNHSVDEYTLDAVYANPDGDADTTIDQIAGYLQGLEADLFDRVIVESQTEALGKEWFGMKQVHSSFLEINRRLLELQMSPYATRLGQNDVQ